MIWTIIKADVLYTLGWGVVYFFGLLGWQLYKARRAQRKGGGRARTFDNSYKAWQMRARDRRRMRGRGAVR